MPRAARGLELGTAIALIIATGGLLAPAARGSESQTLSVAGSNLKWQVRRSAAERARAAQATSAALPGEASPKPLPPDRDQPARKLSASPKPSRAKFRDAVLQASADKADPFKDPFEDDPLGTSSGDKAAAPALPDPTASGGDEPSRPRSDDPFPDERMPSTLEEFERDNQPVVEGAEAPEGLQSCDDYKKECSRAIQELQQRDITKIIFGIVVEGEGGAPAVEGRDYPCECLLGLNATFEDRHWAPTTFTWKAAGTCHKPLYFEDVQLERYGHSWNPVVQPFMSAAHFFLSVPLLPYKMGLNPPCECIYTLGYYRPGSCAPYMIEPIPLSLRGAAFEALGATGFAFWFWPPPTGP